MFPKPVDHGDTNERNIKKEHSTDVGEAGVERFEPFSSGSDIQYCLQDEHIRKDISPSNEYSELISFRTDWFDLFAVHRTVKILIPACDSSRLMKHI